MTNEQKREFERLLEILRDDDQLSEDDQRMYNKLERLYIQENPQDDDK